MDTPTTPTQLSCSSRGEEPPSGTAAESGGAAGRAPERYDPAELRLEEASRSIPSDGAVRRLCRLALVLVVTMVPGLDAATFVVNSPADAVDAVPGDGVCDSAPPAGTCTLRAAVQEANAFAGADTIDLPAGTYTLTIAGSDELAVVGDLDITSDVTLVGAGEAATIVDGGGIDRVFDVLVGGSADASSLTVQNGVIVGSDGGAFQNQGTLTLTDVRLVGGSARIGGGVFAKTATTTLTRVVATGNSAIDGGAIGFKSGSASIVDSTFSANTASRRGGGVHNDGGLVTLTGVTLSGNDAGSEDGGGMVNRGGGATADLVNVTVSGNSAVRRGGGIHNESTVTLTNVTIAGNDAPDGAGLRRQAGSITLTNTIVALNTTGVDCTGGVTSLGNSLDGDGSCAVEITADPLLGVLQNNGGPTETHALLTGSPALDSGSNPACPATDQRGFARPGNVICDIGAYEESFHDIVIDGDLSEWDDGVGNEVCKDDEAGEDDWNNPSTADITKFCAASNLSDQIYLLFGFDDVTFSGGKNPTACVLVDTDAPENGFADYLFCATLEGPGPTQVQRVELFSCDDTSNEGCPGATWVKDYSTSDYGFSNTVDGPFGNPDSFVELAVPWSDIGVSSGQVVFFNLITYQARTLLTSPKDSIFGLVTQNYPKRVDYNLETGESTPVVVSSFEAAIGPRGVVVEWETASEVGTAGFYLYRWDARNGHYRQVNEQLLPAAVGSPQGGIYSVLDREAASHSRLRYALVEVLSGGGEEIYGPFDVRPDHAARGVADLASADSLVRPRGGARMVEDLPWRAAADGDETSEPGPGRNPLDGRNELPGSRTFGPGSGGDAGFGSPLPSPRRLKISVQESGVHFLSAAEIAGAWRKPLRRVERMIRRGGLRLQHGRRQVAWHAVAGDEGILFYAEAIESPYTRENVYWLRRGAGVKMEVESSRRLPATTASSSFRSTIHLERDLFPVTAVPGVAVDDFWFWTFVSAGSPTHARSRHDFAVSALSPLAGEAVLEVSLFATTDTPASVDHHALVRVNDFEIGTISWDGARAQTALLTFPSDLLRDGDNSVEIEALLEAAPYSVFLVDSLRLTYESLLEAADDRLELSVDRAGAVTVSGFSDDAILVFNIREPLRPKLVRGSTLVGSHGGEVSFRASTEATYLAVGADGYLSPIALEGAWTKNLRRRRGAEYVVIAPEALRSAAERLMMLRRSSGLRSMFVDIEDVYDQFSAGVVSPLALQRFLAHAYREWPRPPRYAVLVGDGSLDYKDLLGHGESLLPPRLVPTPHGLYASDGSLGDVVGPDGVPEISVGRIPVRTAEELTAYIDKLEAQERRGGAALDRVVLLADNPDGAGNFTADSESLGGMLPPDAEVERIYLSDSSVAEAKTLLADAMALGPGFLNYIGHGGVDRMAAEGLLLASEAESLGVVGGLPVVAAFTCNVGRFELPGFRSLAEALVLAPEAGAVAMWSPGGQSYNHEARILNQGLVRALYHLEAPTLGDAVLEALSSYSELGHMRYLPDIYNLIGDPATSLR